MDFIYSIKCDKKQTNFIVYLATSPSGKQYVGVTTVGIINRMKKHYRTAKANSNNQLICKAINKYGFENIKWDIIDFAKDKEELIELEIFWINKLCTFKPNGYNSTIGGEGVIGYILTEEEKQKRKNAQKKFIQDHPEMYHRLIENLQKYRENNPDEHSQCMKNIFSSAEKREEMAIKKGSTCFNVYNYNTGNFVGAWINHRECARILNIPPEGIWSCLNKRAKSHKGYIFIDAKEDQCLIPYQTKNCLTCGSFEVYDLQTNECIGVWESQRKCEKDLNINYRIISKCLINKKIYKNRYVFTYKNKEE